MLSLDYRDARPIYEQVRDGLRRLVVTGALVQGEKLPSVRAMASTLAINPNTIQRAYAQLEDQEVAGENITAAMERIEGMMDKVVEGFEKQLDQLFQGDALDITSDVEVLERMLSKDGLSSKDSIRLEL
mgnify:CR=1 FL=1